MASRRRMNMYCSSCGSAVKESLSYCNRCGARLYEERGESIAHTRDIAPESLVWAIIAVLVFGLGLIIGLMAVMKNEVHFNDGVILGFTLLSFLLMVIIEGIF